NRQPRDYTQPLPYNPLYPYSPPISVSFFFNDTATTEIYTLSLHDALPILGIPDDMFFLPENGSINTVHVQDGHPRMRFLNDVRRSEEHTSELQSRGHLVCRLLLEKKKTQKNRHKTVIGYGLHLDDAHRRGV